MNSSFAIDLEHLENLDDAADTFVLFCYSPSIAKISSHIGNQRNESNWKWVALTIYLLNHEILAPFVSGFLKKNLSKIFFKLLNYF